MPHGPDSFAKTVIEFCRTSVTELLDPLPFTPSLEPC